METLNYKIDFAAVLCVTNANPNGDPLNGNRPRTNDEGFGEISDVCIKRKIRNRLMDAGYPIFVQSDDNRVDDCKNLKERAEKALKGIDDKDEKKFRETVCREWLDVRAFGQVFAFSGKKKNNKESEDDEQDSKGVSIGIRGPVSVHPAFSVLPVSTSSIQITKSVSGEGEKKASDTMGMKHRVDFGVYVLYGSMNPQLAIKTGFSDDDAGAIKHAIIHLFNNDASSARPEGSMEVYKAYWWQHNCKNGQYASAKVHRTLHVSLKKGIVEPKSIDDFDISLDTLQGLVPAVYDGE